MTVLELELVDFRPEHARELVLLWRESFEHGVGVVDPHPLADQEHYLMTVVVPNNAVRVAFAEGRMVGFIAATPDSISQLYVRKGFHRRGVGQAMLRWAQERSSGKLRLFTFAKNAVARAFYERNGFRAVALGFEWSWKLDDVTYEWTRPGLEATRPTT